MLTGSDFVTATGSGVFVSATVAVLSRAALAIFPDIVSFTVESCDPLVGVISPNPARRIVPMASIAPLPIFAPTVVTCSSMLEPLPPSIVDPVPGPNTVT